MEKIKLIWDFRGQNALETAKHHAIHIQEYLDIEKHINLKASHEIINEFYAIAYIIVDTTEMKHFRDILKPHRGEWCS